MIKRMCGVLGVDEVFSEEEIRRLRSWPEELGRNELIRLCPTTLPGRRLRR
ncbi:hypothetical protein [Saccharopolyspora pogona]|uniref:hypothetical protein n=1 Tax=Saccharopolyspora pogona TaxID=333966 RepID=UPI0016850F36|nr:hypothetical protein [Saccharopolyspora pogona]